MIGYNSAMRLMIVLVLAGLLAALPSLAAAADCPGQPTAYGRWWRPLVNTNELLAERGECCQLLYYISTKASAEYVGLLPRHRLPIIREALVREWLSTPPRHQPPVIRQAKGLVLDTPGLSCHLPAQVPVRHESESAD